MKNVREMQKRLFNYGANLILLVLSTIVFANVWNQKLNVLLRTPFLRSGNIMMIGVYALMLLIMLYAFQALRIGYYTISNLLISRTIAYVSTHIIMVIQIILVVGQVDYVGIIVAEMFRVLLITGTIEIIYTIFTTRLYNKLIPPYRMLMIYGDYENNLKEKIARRADKYIVEEEIYIGSNEEDIKEKILRYDAIVINDVPTEKRKDILKFCFEEGIRVYFVPKISDIFVKGSTELKLFDTPVFLCRNIQLTLEQRFVKRMMDIVLSALLLILASPFMLIAWIAIKLEDGGPAFFTQKRCTLGGKTFKVYKFRSMRVDAEKDGAQLAKENDSRITKVGAFIRKTRIDELPQLFNILKGDMSFVGPRPERPEFVEEYSKTVPEFAYRMKVKGGLTGYAQVYGKYNTTSLDKLKMDLLYIEKYSILLDIQIILMTIKVVFMKESTEGF